MRLPSHDDDAVPHVVYETSRIAIPEDSSISIETLTRFDHFASVAFLDEYAWIECNISITSEEGSFDLLKNSSLSLLPAVYIMRRSSHFYRLRAYRGLIQEFFSLLLFKPNQDIYDTIVSLRLEAGGQLGSRIHRRLAINTEIEILPVNDPPEITLLNTGNDTSLYTSFRIHEDEISYPFSIQIIDRDSSPLWLSIQTSAGRLGLGAQVNDSAEIRGTASDIMVRKIRL